MCRLCMQTPCHPRCPNAAEAEPLYRCCVCGEGIYEGDKYYQDGDQEICSECMDGMATDELLELFGESLKTA